MGQLVPNSHQVISDFSVLYKNMNVKSRLELFKLLFGGSKFFAVESKGFFIISTKPRYRVFDDLSTVNNN